MTARPSKGEPTLRSVNVWLSEELLAKVDEHARLLGLSRSKYIAEVLRDTCAPHRGEASR